MFGHWLGNADRPRRPASWQPCAVRVERLEERAVPAAAAVDFAAMPILPSFDGVVGETVRAVTRLGRELGNRPNAFIKVGDSITASGKFLTPLADASLGPFTPLAAARDYFNTTDSFRRTSSAARSGATSLSALAALPGEIAAHRPAFAVVMLGTNDIAFTSPDVFRVGLTMIVQQLKSRGVVPLMSTIPDVTFGGSFLLQRTRVFNQIIAEVAVANAVPLMNYWALLQMLPDKGVSSDGVHPTVSPGGGADFSAVGLRYGMNLRNLLALFVLDAARQAAISA